MKQMSFKKVGYIALGWLSLGLGIVGIVVPLLPTTPFILLSAFCVSRSSRRFHLWLLNHKVFGSIVRDWERDGVISLKAKILASVSMISMVSLSLYLVALPMFAIVMITLTIVAVLLFIWTRPSQPRAILNKSHYE